MANDIGPLDFSANLKHLRADIDTAGTQFGAMLLLNGCDSRDCRVSITPLKIFAHRLEVLWREAELFDLRDLTSVQQHAPSDNSNDSQDERNATIDELCQNDGGHYGYKDVHVSGQPSECLFAQSNDSWNRLVRLAVIAN